MSERMNSLHDLFEEQDETSYPPPEYRSNLGCPFAKHNGRRYELVNNSCTQRWGFKSIGLLNEHIQRVHSLQFGCITCKKRFTKCKKADLEQAKDEHQCSPRLSNSEDPEWLDEEQESRFANWNDQGHAQEGSMEKWKRIYLCLFANDEKVPDPCYDYLVPKHFKSPENPVTQSLALHDNDDEKLSKVIDPSLISESRNLPPDMSDSRAFKTPERPQLESKALAKNEDQYDYGFPFSVFRGTDSGYGSGKNPPEPQTPDVSLFPGDNLPSMFPPGPELDACEDGCGSLLGIGGRFSPNPSEIEPMADLDNYVDYHANDEMRDDVANE